GRAAASATCWPRSPTPLRRSSPSFPATSATRARSPGTPKWPSPSSTGPATPTPPGGRRPGCGRSTGPPAGSRARSTGGPTASWCRWCAPATSWSRPTGRAASPVTCSASSRSSCPAATSRCSGSRPSWPTPWWPDRLRAGERRGPEADEGVGGGLGPPDLAGAAEELADVARLVGQGVGGEGLGGRIEADDGVGPEVRQPHPVAVVHVDGVGLGLVAGEAPFLPAPGGGVVAADLAGVPLADPQAALGVGPDPAGALVTGGRFDHRRLPGGRIDAGDVAGGEGGEPHTAVGRGGDAVGARSPGGVPHLHGAAGRVEAAVDAGVAGEPQGPAPVEGGGVGDGPLPLRRERKPLDGA